MPKRSSMRRSRRHRSRRMAYGLAGGRDYYGGLDPDYFTVQGGGPAPVAEAVGGGADAVAVPGGARGGRSRRRRRSSRRRSSRRRRH